MDKKKLMEAYVAMSPEDQEAVRAEILKQLPAAESYCSGGEMSELKTMFSKMEASGNPMGMCAEMMKMCHEKMATTCSS